MDNTADIVLRERLEQDRFIKTVQKLRTERTSQFLHHMCLSVRFDVAVVVNAVEQVLCTDVGGHDQDRILKVNRPALRIRDAPVIQHL